MRTIRGRQSFSPDLPAVSGTVVDDDQLEIGPGLGEDRADRPADVWLLVVEGNDNGEFQVTHRPSSSSAGRATLPRPESAQGRTLTPRAPGDGGVHLLRLEVDAVEDGIAVHADFLGPAEALRVVGKEDHRRFGKEGEDGSMKPHCHHCPEPGDLPQDLQGVRRVGDMADPETSRRPGGHLLVSFRSP